jgi:hypothetical protein
MPGSSGRPQASRAPSGNGNGTGAASHPPTRRQVALRWTRGVPGAVWWVTATFVTLLAAYSLVTPIYQAPDEPQHVDMAEAVSEDLSYPQWDARRIDPGVQRGISLAGVEEHPTIMFYEEALPRDDRPSNEELGERPLGTRLNQLAQHPPLYYAALGVTDRLADVLIPGDPFHAYDQQAWFYRAVSLVMVAPLPLLTWITARRMGVPRPIAIAASMLPMAVPQLLHIGASVNNDNLFALLVWCLSPVLVSVARGDLRLRTLSLAGLIVGLALFTKGTALVLPLWVALALVVGWFKAGRPRLGTLLTPVAACGALLVALGGWWWVRNVIVFGKMAPSTEYLRFSTTDGRDTAVTRWLHAWAYNTNKRFWGEFGWLEVQITPKLFVPATIVAIVGLVLALRPRPFGVALSDRLVLLACWPLIAGLTAYNAFQLYADSGQLPLLQGRYWFGAMVAFAVLVALGLSLFFARGPRWMPLAVVPVIVVVQVVAIATIAGYYWGPPGTSVNDRVRTLIVWSPFPGDVLVAGFVVAVLVVAATLVALVRELSVPPEQLFPPAGTAPAGTGAGNGATAARPAPPGPTSAPAPTSISTGDGPAGRAPGPTPPTPSASTASAPKKVAQ